jgi:hypothetical protein
VADIQGLAQNRWEFYDEKRMKRLKAMIIIPLTFVLWALFTFLVYQISRMIEVIQPGRG